MVDLRSDTVTTPSEQMRETARSAPVGDDVYKEDPTVEKLESRLATRLGFEAGLFVPSGTMGNQIAVRTHTDRGQEVVLDAKCHIYEWEVGGLAQLSEVQPRPIDSYERGIPAPEQITEAYQEESLHKPGTGLLTLENTHNSRGGIAISPDRINAATETAHNLGIPVHLDGARVFNAAVAHNISASKLTAKVDSASVCLSKGLGAPIGSVLVGSVEFIEAARRHRKLLGGGMRQAGIIAGPALVALENIDRLHKDHKNATHLAEALADVPELNVTSPETNIVLVDTTNTGMTAAEFLELCEDEGVLGTEYGTYTARFCTHLDIDRSDIDTAINRISSLFASTAI